MLQLSHVTKSFGATRAVDDVSLEIASGGIVALVGENGAGKTTLMRIAAGELAAESGSVTRTGGIGFVHQHFQLVGELTIAENLALASSTRFRFATARTLEREAETTIAATGIAMTNVSRRVADLSVGEKSKLELIKAIAKKPATLILDEPTSVLTPYEAEELFRVMRRLAAAGTAVVFISHKLPEVLAVADRVVVMRGGKIVAETRASDSTAEDLARAMVPLVSRSGSYDDKQNPEGLPREGEIAAIVGVAGNGQTELAARLRDRFPDAAHIPEDRTRDGLVAEMTIAENLALRSSRSWNPREAARHAEEMIALYSVRASGPYQRAGDLSGGNQQKVILARELSHLSHRSHSSHESHHLIVAAEPTRGLDIEATRFVHDQLRAAADSGAAILLITSDLDEAFALADTIQVIYRGTLSERMTPDIASGKVANLMAGIA
ncbi:MAG TPA: ATP-binding cassette domain-containing protein [Thermoanaerobaculia bacterium]|nr:ATP-binding cassette domain-containing protein [Thermoanaerobaculia bacterium]